MMLMMVMMMMMISASQLSLRVQILLFAMAWKYKHWWLPGESEPRDEHRFDHIMRRVSLFERELADLATNSTLPRNAMVTFGRKKSWSRDGDGSGHQF
jgi:hypothetical protein